MIKNPIFIMIIMIILNKNDIEYNLYSVQSCSFLVKYCTNVHFFNILKYCNNTIFL